MSGKHGEDTEEFLSQLYVSVFILLSSSAEESTFAIVGSGTLTLELSEAKALVRLSYSRGPERFRGR